MKWSLLVKVVAVSAAVVSGIGSSSAFAAFVPPNLPIGTQYQLLFVTSGTLSGHDTDIETYNAFAAAEAALNPALPLATWHAVVSTHLVNASTNAPSSNMRVYDTSGRLVSDNLYVTSAAPIKNQFGVNGASAAWTGSDPSGIEAQDGQAPGPHGLGNFSVVSYQYGDVTYGPVIGLNTNTATFGSWLQWNVWNSVTGFGDSLPIYALSSPITAGSEVPEPSNTAIVAVFMGCFIGLHQNRRTRAILGLWSNPSSTQHPSPPASGI